MERTGTSRSCPSGPARQVAGRHVVGQPDAVGGLVEGVAGRVHGRGVHRQDDGRLAARAHLGRGRRGGGRTRLTRTSRGTPPPSPRPSPAPGRAREFLGHKATPTISEGPLSRRGPALPSLPAPGSRGSVRACGVETKRAIAHPSMRSRKWLPGRGPPRWSRPPHGKRGVEQHLEGWSHADGPIGTKPAETGGGHRAVERKPGRLSSVWPQPISIDDIASRKAASSASEASSGVERGVSSVPRPIPACRSRVTVMAIRADHGPPSRLGASTKGGACCVPDADLVPVTPLIGTTFPALTLDSPRYLSSSTLSVVDLQRSLSSPITQRCLGDSSPRSPAMSR